MVKLPRCAVVSMYAACAVVIAAMVWWWSGLPDRTMNDVVKFLSDGGLHLVPDIVRFPDSWTVQPDGELRIAQPEISPETLSVQSWETCFLSREIEPQSRTVWEYIVGERRFRSKVWATPPPRSLHLGPGKTPDEVMITTDALVTIDVSVEQGVVQIQPLRKSSLKWEINVNRLKVTDPYTPNF